MRRPFRTWLQRLGVIIASMAASAALRWMLRPVLGDTAPFLLFFPAIIVSAWYGGFWGGFGATVLGAVLARFVIVQHAAEAFAPPNQFVLYAIYALIGGLISGLVEAMNRARWRAEQAREDHRIAIEALESASRAKDAFLATLSHELRTPLTPVLLGVSGLETDPRLPGEIRHEIRMIHRNVQMEARLIDDLLDLSRIVQGKMPLQIEVMDAHAKIRNSIDICMSEIHAKRLKLNQELRAERHFLRADAARFQQVMWNLIKNAAKFTPAGGSITVATADEEGDRLRIEVIDSGIGIEADVLLRLFDAFEQGGRETTRRFGGLGLGLAISRAIVEAHGGMLTASSAGKGQGATFTVEFKDAEYPPDAAREPPRANDDGHHRELRILLAEDHADTARVMRRLLVGLGHHVSVAESVASAVELASTGAFDLLISDLGLPDGSGLDLMRRLRTMPGIALTGYGMESDIRETREAGFKAHLTKPVDVRQLEATIQQVISP